MPVGPLRALVRDVEGREMATIKGFRLHVNLSAAQARRRLKGLGFGGRKVESAGRGEAIIIHTATGEHLRELCAIFQDAIVTGPRTPSAARSGRHGRTTTTVTPGRYRHYKGNTYTVIGVARHSETEEELVVYRQEYGDHGLWVRPKAMFLETVERHGQQVPRFEYVGPG